MARTVNLFSLLTAALLLGSCGCGSDSDPETAGADAAQQSAEGSQNASSAAEPSEAKPADDPAVAIQNVFRGLKNQQPQAVWEFLPASYQNDVNDVVHDFANQMDADLWSRSFGTLRNITEILKTKKEFIFENAEMKQAEKFDPEMLATNWDGLVGVLSTLVNSEIGDLEQMKNVDVGEYVAQTGGSLVNQLSSLSKLVPGDPFNSALRDLMETQVDLISSEGDTARVQLTPVDLTQSPREVDMIRLEGKWIPKSLSDGWQTNVSLMKLQIAAGLAPKAIAPRKETMLQTLDVVDQVVDELLEANTAEDFNSVVAQRVLPNLAVLMLMAGMSQSGRPIIDEGDSANSGPEDSSKDTVTLLIRVELDEKSEDRLIGQLLDCVDDPDLGLASAPEVRAGVTSFQISPVSDIAAFAKKLEFLNVVSVDVEERRITVELK